VNVPPMTLGSIRVAPDLAVGFGTIEVTDATVIAPEGELSVLGARVLGSGTVVVGSSTEVQGDRPTVLLAEGPTALAALEVREGEHGVPDVILVPVASDSRAALAAFMEQHDLAATAITASGTFLRVEVRQAENRDALNSSVVPLVVAWSEERTLRTRLADEAVQLAQELALVLDALDLVDDPIETPAEKGLEDPVTVLPPSDLTALVHLQKKFDSLQRKYDSLAGSRLGRVQLGYWERKKEKNSRA